MSQSNNAGITTKGLVFAYDMNSLRSYKGRQGTNLLQYIVSDSLNVTSNNNYRVSSGTEDVYIPTIGEMKSVVYTDVMNDYNNSYGGGGSGSCCPRIMRYAEGVSVSPSTTYTYAIVYKATSGYTNSNYMYQYHYTANGGSYVTEFGLHDTNKRIHLGDGWYWAWNTFTTGAGTNWIGTMGMWHYEYRTYSRVYVAKALLAQGDWTGVHPKYWPNVATTRSNTQTLLDLTGNYTLTAANITYNSDGSFEFNGSNSCYDLNTTSLIAGAQDFTIEAIYNATSGSGGREIIGNYGSGYTSDSIWFATHGFWLNGGVGYHSGGQLTGTNHTAVTRSGSFITTYKNGNVDVTGTTTASVATNINWRIGKDVNGDGEPFAGKIYAIRVYNRALSSTEIKQSFNAQRSKYGL